MYRKKNFCSLMNYYLEDGLALELIGRVQNNTFNAADKSIVWPG